MTTTLKMDRATVKKLACTLKGAPLSCLFVMLSEETAWGTLELAEMTNYNRKTISQGLEKLKEAGLAQSHRRFSGWCLTREGYQLAIDLNPQKPALPGPNGTEIEGEKLLVEGEKMPLNGEKLPDEGKKLPLDQRSSSSIDSNDSLNTKLLLLNNEGKKLPNEGEKLLLAELLVKAGCPRRTAQPAIEAALKRGETSEYVEGQIKAWLSYCQSENGVGINNPPLFIAAKIKNGEPAPKVASKEKEDEIQWIT